MRATKIFPKNRNIVKPYLNAIVRELKAYKALVADPSTIEQIHWGGGSPDFLTPDETIELHDGILSVFPNLTPDADVSVELDPRTTTQDHIKSFVDSGFTRISMGVQDFDPFVQKTINRYQSF